MNDRSAAGRLAIGVTRASLDKKRPLSAFRQHITGDRLLIVSGIAQRSADEPCGNARAHCILAAGALVFFAVLPAPSYEGDLEFWSPWMGQLQHGGFAALDANYPPLYLYWLRVVGALYGALGATPAVDALLKFWAVLPALVVQLGLGSTLADRLRQHGVDPGRRAYASHAYPESGRPDGRYARGHQHRSLTKNMTMVIILVSYDRG